jgi:hypothetical protein
MEPLGYVSSAEAKANNYYQQLNNLFAGPVSNQTNQPPRLPGAVKLKYSISIFVANVAVGLYVNERHTMMKGNSKFMKRDSKFGQRRINAHATANRLLLISRTLAWFYLLARNQPSSGEFLQKI